MPLLCRHPFTVPRLRWHPGAVSIAPSAPLRGPALERAGHRGRAPACGLVHLLVLLDHALWAGASDQSAPKRPGWPVCCGDVVRGAPQHRHTFSELSLCTEYAVAPNPPPETRL